jgi:Transglycosylase SLT domain
VAKAVKLAISAAVVLPLLLMVLLLGAVTGAPNATATIDFGTSQPSEAALADIPENYLRIYQRAGAEKGLDWAYLAAIGKIESDHGRSSAEGVRPPFTNFHGCCAGPMQFCVIDGCPEVGSKRLTVAQAQAGTWQTMGVDGDKDGQKNPWDPEDAIPAAANYLAESGAPSDWRGALLKYNQSTTYVANVIAQANAYRGALLNVKGPSNVADGAMRQAVIGNQSIIFARDSAEHERSIRDGQIDGRIVAVLDWIGKSHQVVVSSMRFGRSGASNHPPGRAIDIAFIDGQPCNGSRENACGRLAVQLAQIKGPLHSSELIYCFDPDGPDNLGTAGDAFADPPGDAGLPDSHHCDHIHFGYDQ